MKPGVTSRRSQLNRPTVFFALLTALSPLGLLVSLYLYVLAARLHLGHWPSYGNPDPKAMGWWILHSSVALGYMTLPIAPSAVIIFSIVCRAINREFPLWRIIAIAILATGSTLICLRMDPGGFVDWYWD